MDKKEIIKILKEIKNMICFKMSETEHFNLMESFNYLINKIKESEKIIKLSKRIDLVNIELSEIEKELEINLFLSERKTIKETKRILFRLYNQAIKYNN